LPFSFFVFVDLRGLFFFLELQGSHTCSSAGQADSKVETTSRSPHLAH